jgi:FMN phosphatase YigB (HAD superfamily)
MEDLGVMEHLSPVLVSEKEGIEKPSLSIFLEACVRAKVRPHEVLHVGDELDGYAFTFRLFGHACR